MLSFILSTVWIAVFSYFMVWMVSVIAQDFFIFCFILLLIVYLLVLTRNLKMLEIFKIKEENVWAYLMLPVRVFFVVFFLHYIVSLTMCVGV